MDIENAKDGFDLIDYPCDFNFKAMCKASAVSCSESYVKQVINNCLPSAKIVGLVSNTSRTGKFIAVTITVTLAGRDELERVYTALKEAEHVVMTL